jgi:hypothetical protein
MNGVILTVYVASKLLRIAADEVGYHEQFKNGTWNNNQKYSDEVPTLTWSDYQAWCQTFQSWLAMKAGSATYEPCTASCLTACNWFKKAGRFSEYPAIGAQVFYGANGGEHVGRVWKYDATYIWTREGNTNDNGSAQGDGVYELKRERRSARVYGYGLPAFPEGIVTADPALKGKPGYVYKATADAPVLPVYVPPAVEYVTFPGAAWFKTEPSSAVVTAMGKRIVAEGYKGYKVGPGKKWTDADRAAMAWWQRTYSKRHGLGWTGEAVDGWPGKTSWDALKVPKS